MEGKSSVPAPVVFGQDEQTEVHVQAIHQSGRRQVDIRIWRRGPAGFAPSRNALTVNGSDLDALQQGIVELLEASNRGRQVARVVWENGEGRRLRAETEPFGTRYTARFGFWQRVRDTWRSADDGLVLPADQLRSLQTVLRRFRPWTHARDSGSEDYGPKPKGTDRWPAPGADWLTVEPEHIAFHPRGLRITCTVEELDERHRLILRQWRREDSLFVPEDTVLALSLIDIEALAEIVDRLADAPNHEEHTDGKDLQCVDGWTLHVGITGGAAGPDLCLEQRQQPADAGRLAARARIVMPTEYIPRFGRLLAESWLLLAGQLSELERNEIPDAQERLPDPPQMDRSEKDEELLDVEQIVASQQLMPQQADPGDSVLESSGQLRPAEEFELEMSDVEVNESESQAVVTPLDTLQLGRHEVTIMTEDLAGARQFALSWDGQALQVSAGDLEELLADIRALYYDALRGRRGSMMTVGSNRLVQVSVHHQEGQLYFAIRHETDNEACLSFPVSAVPTFLDAGRKALSH